MSTRSSVVPQLSLLVRGQASVRQHKTESRGGKFPVGNSQTPDSLQYNPTGCATTHINNQPLYQLVFPVSTRPAFFSLRPFCSQPGSQNSHSRYSPQFTTGPSVNCPIANKLTQPLAHSMPPESVTPPVMTPEATLTSSPGICSLIITSNSKGSVQSRCVPPSKELLPCSPSQSHPLSLTLRSPGIAKL